MEPTYDKNDVVFVIPKEQYNIGDVITYKKDNEITGYLTNGYYRRDIFESSAVISAMQTLLNFKSNYKKLEKEI